MPLCSACGGNTFIPRVVGEKIQTESDPPFAQPDEVASILENIERDLENYEAEICRIRKEKGRLEHYAAQLRSLSSPFRKIPNEILRQILDDCCDMNSFRAVDLKRRLPTQTAHALTSKPAMVVSSVCSRWRQTALSMPAIWSRISLYWDVHGEDHNWEYEDIEIVFPLSCFLIRSQQHPMTLNLDLEARPFILIPTRGLHLHLLLTRLFEQIICWQSLSYRCEYYSFEEFLNHSSIPSASFPVLRRLCFAGSVMEEDLTPFTTTAPNLQMLDLPDTPVPHSSYPNSHQVDIQDVFNKFPNLFSLGLTESTLYSNGVSPVTIACSSKLEMLTIHHREGWKDPSDSSAVFPLLRLPSLKVLHLVTDKSESTDSDIYRLWDDQSWSNLEPFVVFVQQSALQLTAFSIQGLSISDANLVKILVLLPTLQDLTVDDSGIPQKCSSISSEFIEGLHTYRTSSLRPQEACIVPRLRSLRLLNVAAPMFKDWLVVEMVKSRWIPAKVNAVGTSAFKVDCLRVFTMTFVKRWEENPGHSYSLLAPIERNGMMIVIQISGKTLGV
ncbi:hypothetical protein BDP27DRAFT_1332263 [Rhodocollybia butyracea]|uniref:F-box domain-containing protein n=1 Tax=Rhodocollybia butyracea TaxID=206335 RepID=A0A9P5PL45_9AGAR|nr:hypothetical protein BDP27DRAFT_1332263 [Rhodocollybia butyracea]